MTAAHAVLVTARVTDAINAPNALDVTRTRAVLARAIELTLARDDFRIVHVAVRRARVDLIVEAATKHALARGMQGFQVSAARALNRAVRRRGRVFVDRYRAHALTSRAAVAAALATLPRHARARLATPESPLFV